MEIGEIMIAWFKRWVLGRPTKEVILLLEVHRILNNLEEHHWKHMHRCQCQTHKELNIFIGKLNMLVSIGDL